MVEDNEIISRNIKAVRAQRGYTQGQVANMLNISVPTYIRMEKYAFFIMLHVLKNIQKN